MYKREDFYHKKARSLGYKSRSAFKLIEIDKKFQIFRKGFSVLDLGAAPGGWLQVASRKVGSKGYVLGVDIKPIGKIAENVKTKVSDIYEFNPNKMFDVVLSDLSPKTFGIKHRDLGESARLANRAFEIAQNVLKPGGSFVVKVFDGPEANSLYGEMKNFFKKVKKFRPSATRKSSSEVYLIGLHAMGSILTTI